MTRWGRVLLLLGFGLILVTPRPAGAFWEWVGKMSGPGPFVGLDVVFPYSLSRAELSVPINNMNVEQLAALGIHTALLSEDVAEFKQNVNHQELLARECGLSFAGPGKSQRTPGMELSGPIALNAACRVAADDEDLDVLEDGSTSQEQKLEALNNILLAVLSDRLRERTRNYGAGPGGLFSGFRAIPSLRSSDGRTPINNRFFTLSVGFAFAEENDITYPEGFNGDRDVVWLSLYPALEQRIPLRRDGEASLSLQIGPAGHYFLGAQFDDFWKGSVRARAGIQWKWLYVGGQLDYFLSAIGMDDFGAVGDAKDLERWSPGLFIGLDLTGGAARLRSK